jgi:hypothetical protein
MMLSIGKDKVILLGLHGKERVRREELGVKS